MRALRIRHYIAAIVAGCSLGGLTVTFGLIYIYRSIESQARDIQALSTVLTDVRGLHQEADSWIQSARSCLRTGSPSCEEVDGRKRALLVRVDELERDPSMSSFDRELSLLRNRVEAVREGLRLDPDRVKGQVEELEQWIFDGLARIEGGIGKELQELEQELEIRRGHLWRTASFSLLSYATLVLLLWRWTVWRLISPLQALTEESRHSLDGVSSVRLVPRGPREVQVLAESLSTLVQSLLESRSDLEEKVRKRTLELEQASRAKNEFLANMSHEIRTPMTAILGYAELCLAADTSEDERKRYSQVIFTNGEHLLGVINDILDVAKIEAGRMTVEPTLCSPFDVVSEVVGLMEIPAKERGLDLIVRNEGQIPEVVRTDPTRLRQILINLVGNAIKFTDEGEVTLAFRMERVEGGPETLVFEVHDTGVGMSSDQIERVFQPFIQADSSTTRRYGGTGLGLAISRTLARMLGGDIVCESEPGKGSIFRVTIAPGPLDGVRRLGRFPAASQGSRAIARAPLARSPGLRGRVLLAEDVAVNRRLISLILERAGVSVEPAENGRMAQEKARAALDAGEPYDIVFMDIQMPEMDGYEATRRLREGGYGNPIVALTSHSMPEERERCLQAGCDDYMTKPIDKMVLLRVLNRFLQDRGEQRSAV